MNGVTDVRVVQEVDERNNNFTVVERERCGDGRDGQRGAVLADLERGGRGRSRRNLVFTVGAVGGAVTGGGAGTGAIVGAAIGGTAALIQSALRRSGPDPTFKAHVSKCLKDRGYDVIGWD